MSITLAFDVYGTLVDTHGVVTTLQHIVGNQAADFSRTWRDKQLEYSFRRGLMQKYENFAVCISQALDYTCSYYKVALTQAQQQDLLDIYRTLPAFNDVQEALTSLKTNSFQLYAFSNGSKDTIETLLSAAAIRDFFLDVISVEEQKTFKPDPAVYQHFLTKTGSTGNNAWLISSNPFDVIGAISVGMKAAWVQRSPEVIFDPWDIQPTLTVSSLSKLKQQIEAY